VPSAYLRFQLEGETLLVVRIILNILWVVLAGVWLAISYVIAAVLLTLTIIGIPFARQALKLAHYALWPFGRTLVQSSTRHTRASAWSATSCGSYLRAGGSRSST
jgi:uncharacterized membrane protein YccF (DUF307 family)